MWFWVRHFLFLGLSFLAYKMRDSLGFFGLIFIPSSTSPKPLFPYSKTIQGSQVQILTALHLSVHFLSLNTRIYTPWGQTTVSDCFTAISAIPWTVCDPECDLKYMHSFTYVKWMNIFLQIFMGNKLAWHNFQFWALSVVEKWLEMASVSLLHGSPLGFWLHRWKQ